MSINTIWVLCAWRKELARYRYLGTLLVISASGSFHGRSFNGCQVKHFIFFQISSMVLIHWDEKILKIWWPYRFSLQSLAIFVLMSILLVRWGSKIEEIQILNGCHDRTDTLSVWFFLKSLQAWSYTSKTKDRVFWRFIGELDANQNYKNSENLPDFAKIMIFKWQ